MNVVYKYPISNEDDFFLPLPLGAQILSFQAQGDDLALWALVDTESRPIDRMFILADTGWPLPYAETLKYIGTAQTPSRVLHLFERFL